MLNLLLPIEPREPDTCIAFAFRDHILRVFVMSFRNWISDRSRSPYRSFFDIDDVDLAERESFMLRYLSAQIPILRLVSEVVAGALKWLTIQFLRLSLSP